MTTALLLIRMLAALIGALTTHHPLATDEWDDPPIAVPLGDSLLG